MKRFIKKIYLILFLSTILSFSTAAFAKSNKIDLFQENISNYFSGIISFNKDYTSSKCEKARRHMLDKEKEIDIPDELDGTQCGTPLNDLKNVLSKKKRKTKKKTRKTRRKTRKKT